MSQFDTYCSCLQLGSGKDCQCIFSSEPSLLAKELYGKASPEIKPAASLDTCIATVSILVLLYM